MQDVLILRPTGNWKFNRQLSGNNHWTAPNTFLMIEESGEREYNILDKDFPCSLRGEMELIHSKTFDTVKQLLCSCTESFRAKTRKQCALKRVQSLPVIHSLLQRAQMVVIARKADPVVYR